MADTWGTSWQGAWALSWARSGTTPQTPPAKAPGAGSSKRQSKKRWWQVGDKLYFGTKVQIADALDVFIRQQEGVAVEMPELPSKPAQATPKTDAVITPLPDLAFDAIDWAPIWRLYALQKDWELARAWEEAIRRRMDDEDDIEMILLTVH